MERKQPRLHAVTRRDAVKSMLFISGSLVFAGAGRSDIAAAQGKTRIVQWYHQYGEAGTEDAVKRYASEYTKENADVEIEVVWQMGDYGAALNAALLTDKAPDVYEIGGAPTIDMQRQNQLTPLDDLYTDEIKKDFLPGTLKACTIDGKLYSVKMIEDTGGVFYRKSLFEKAGVQAPETLDQLIEVVNKLGGGRTKALFVGNDGGVGALGGPLVWSSGADFLTEDGTAPAFNTDRVQTAVTKFGEVSRGQNLLMGSPTDYWDPSAFNQNLCAMQFTGLWAVPAMQKALADDFDVFAWPKSDDQGEASTFWGGWYECVNGNSKVVEPAKKFVKWLWIDKTDLQQDWCLSYGFHVPARISLSKAAEPLKTGVPAKMVEILGNNARLGNIRWTGAMGTALSDALTKIIREGADAKTELAKAEEIVKKELAR